MKRVMKVLCAENSEWWHKPAVLGIEKTEGTDFNHVAFLTEMNFVYEAVWPKARKSSLDKWKKRFKVIRTYELHLEPNEYQEMMELISLQVGKPYSVFQCAMIWVAQSFAGIQKDVESINWNGDKALICSEFVARPIKKVFNFSFNQGIDSIGMDEIEQCLKSISFRWY